MAAKTKDRLILEVGMCRLDHACDAVDFVRAPIDAVGLIKNGILVKHFLDRRTPSDGITLAEDILQIAREEK